MPPVRGASRLAAGAENALVETIEELPVFSGLVVLFLALDFLVLSLEEGVNGLVLGVEVRHINDEILENKHEHQGRHSGLLIVIFGDAAQAS